MKPETQAVIRAAIALQIAALEWDADDTAEQSEAVMAFHGINEAMNLANMNISHMRNISHRRIRAS